MGQRTLGICVVLWVAGTVAAQAQIAPVGVPRGLLRLEVDGSFDAFGDRYADGHRESYAADLWSPALGRDRIPALAAVDMRIGQIIGDHEFRINLGRFSADAEGDLSTAVVGLGLGLTNRLTVFGRLPLVRGRLQTFSRLDPATADAGFVIPGQETADFFQQFDAALGTLNAKLAAGDYDSDPAKKALAQTTYADATALHDNLFAILANPAPSAPFAPTTTSAAGGAIATRVVELQTTLDNDLNVSGFILPPTLPTEVPTAEAFAGFLSAANGLAYRTTDAEIRFRGDAETGLAYTLVDTWDRPGRRGGVRMALSALVRFPTGVRKRPDRLLDLGTGDGQTDIEIGLVTDLGGSRWGTRLTGAYVRQLPADIAQRVTPPTQPLAGPERLAVIRWNPGDVVAIGVRPFYRLANALALQVGADHWRRGADQTSYATPGAAIPGVDAAVLALDSRVSATTITAGLTYASPGQLRPGGRGWPVEASWVYERVVSGSEGRVPAVQRLRASLRLYFRAFR